MSDNTTPLQSIVVQPAAAPAQLNVNVALLAEWAGAIIAIVTVLALLSKTLSSMVGREIGDVRRDVGAAKHKADNTSTHVDQLERLRTADVERIVRLEVAYQGIEKGFDRIEQRLTTEFDQLSQSVREIRDVRPRGERA